MNDVPVHADEDDVGLRETRNDRRGGQGHRVAGRDAGTGHLDGFVPRRARIGIDAGDHDERERRREAKGTYALRYQRPPYEVLRNHTPRRMNRRLPSGCVQETSRRGEREVDRALRPEEEEHRIDLALLGSGRGALATSRAAAPTPTAQSQVAVVPERDAALPVPHDTTQPAVGSQFFTVHPVAGHATMHDAAPLQSALHGDEPVHCTLQD